MVASKRPPHQDLVQQLRRNYFALIYLCIGVTILLGDRLFG